MSKKARGKTKLTHRDRKRMFARFQSKLAEYLKKTEDELKEIIRQGGEKLESGITKRLSNTDYSALNTALDTLAYSNKVKDKTPVEELIDSQQENLKTYE